MPTTITLVNSYGTYSITANKDDMGIGEVCADLLEPVLLAAGYHPESVKEWVGGEE
jgi:hypothetical protein